MTPREALNRALTRGAHIERRTRHHVKLRRGHRATTIPFYAGHLPDALVADVQRDLGVDFRRGVKARRAREPLFR